MKKVLLNLSGHKLSELARELLNKEYDQIEQLPIVDFNFSGDLESQIKHIIDKVESDLTLGIKCTIILPGQSTLSMLIVAYLHGILGHFPDICLLEENTEGIYVPTNSYSIDINKFRTSGRFFRHEKW